MNTAKSVEFIHEDREVSIETISPDELPRWMHASERPTIIEFYATWCIYHLLTKKKLEKLKRELGDNVQAGCIDSIGNEGLFHQLGIHQIPTIGYFHGNKQVLWHGDTDLEVMLEQIHSIGTQAE